MRPAVARAALIGALLLGSAPAGAARAAAGGRRAEPRPRGPLVRAVDRAAHAIGDRADRFGERLQERSQGIAAQRHPHRAALARRVGGATKLLLGYETWSKTSLEVGGGLRLYVPGLRAINGGFFVNYWTGDLQHAKAGTTGKKVNAGLVAESPVAQLQAARIGGVGGGVSLPLLSAFVDQKQWRLKAGVPGILAASVGDFEGRSSFVEASAGIPLTVAGPVGLQANVHLFVYSPILQPLTRRLKPVAVKVRDGTQRLEQRVHDALGRLRHGGRRAAAGAAPPAPEPAP